MKPQDRTYREVMWAEMEMKSLEEYVDRKRCLKNRLGEMPAETKWHCTKAGFEWRHQAERAGLYFVMWLAYSLKGEG